MKTINVTKMKEELSKRYHTSFVEQILRTVEEFEEKTTLEFSNEKILPILRKKNYKGAETMKAIDLIKSWENDDFDWKNYSEQLKRENSQLHFEIKQAKKRETELRAGMQWFVNCCENGEVKSKKTYQRFKELLNKK